MFFIKSESRKVNLIILSITLSGFILVGVAKYNTTSISTENCNCPEVIEAKLEWDWSCNAIWCINIGSKNQFGVKTSYGKVVILGVVIWDGKNH